METYRSGWIAKHTGLTRKTMENYARRGYIHPRQRNSTNDYREYTMKDIETAWKIKQLISVGYTHADIARMLQSPEGLDFRTTIRQKIRLLEQQRDEISRKIAYAERLAESGTIPPVAWKE